MVFPQNLVVAQFENHPVLHEMDIITDISFHWKEKMKDYINLYPPPSLD